MNNDRRARLQKIADQLEDLRTQLEEIKGEEQDAYDNLPESFQNGERGEKMQTAIDALDNCDSDIETVVSAINEAIEA